MKWENIVGMGLGGMFIVKVIENGRKRSLVTEAQKLREITQKPILLISSNKRNGFDVHIDPANTIAYQLPYANKVFAAIVADCLEDMPYPQQAVAEWSRVADRVFVTSHLFFSPECWLDLRHQHVFLGNKTIKINPTLNWGILSGIAYYLYIRSRKPRKNGALPPAETPKALPNTPPVRPAKSPVVGELWRTEEAESPIEIEEEEESPVETEEEESHLSEASEELPEMEDVKIESAPLVKPEDVPSPKWMEDRKEELVPKAIRPVRTEARKPRMPREASSEASKTEKDMLDGITWRRGTTNLNIGDTISSVTTRLGIQGVQNLTFDPVKMPENHNQSIMTKLEKKPADTVTLNLLDHIPDEEERLAALQVAQENVKRGGEVYIDVSDTQKYMKEIKQFFPNAVTKNGYVVGINKREGTPLPVKRGD